MSNDDEKKKLKPFRIGGKRKDSTTNTSNEDQKKPFNIGGSSSKNEVEKIEKKKPFKIGGISNKSTNDTVKTENKSKFKIGSNTGTTGQSSFVESVKDAFSTLKNHVEIVTSKTKEITNKVKDVTNTGRPITSNTEKPISEYNGTGKFTLTNLTKCDDIKNSSLSYIYYGVAEDIVIEDEKREQKDRNKEKRLNQFYDDLHNDNALEISYLSYKPIQGFSAIPTYSQFQQLFQTSESKIKTLNSRQEKQGLGNQLTNKYLSKYVIGTNAFSYKVLGKTKSLKASMVNADIMYWLEQNDLKPDLDSYELLLSKFVKYLNTFYSSSKVVDYHKSLITISLNPKYISCSSGLYYYTIKDKKFFYYEHEFKKGDSPLQKNEGFVTKVSSFVHELPDSNVLQPIREEIERCFINHRDNHDYKAWDNELKRIEKKYSFTRGGYLKREEYDREYKHNPSYSEQEELDFFSRKNSLTIRSDISKQIEEQHSYDLFIKREEQNSHSYIVAGTKSGKSELLKFLFVQEIMKGNRNAILLDPHGDLAEEIIKLPFITKQYADNIIYIDTQIKDVLGEENENLPCINPFDIDEKYLNDNDKIDNVSAEITKAFEEICKATNSPNMQALLVPCISVLLRKKDATILDLKRFMNDEVNEDLVKLGLESPNLAHRGYFKYDFKGKSPTETKRAVSIRLQTMLNSSLFTKMTCGKSTIRFHDFVRGKGKFLIIRLSKNNTSSIQNELGILIVNSLLNAAYSTKQSERIGVHLFLDEFQNFVSSNIEDVLSQARKYELYLSMAHQFLDQIQNIQVKKGVLANTNIKIVGSISGNTVGQLQTQGEKELFQENVDTLGRGKFLIRVKSEGSKYKYLKVLPTIVKGKVKDIDDQSFKRFLEKQYNQYYKSQQPEEEKQVNEGYKVEEEYLNKDTPRKTTGKTTNKAKPKVDISSFNDMDFKDF